MNGDIEAAMGQLQPLVQKLEYRELAAKEAASLLEEYVSAIGNNDLNNTIGGSFSRVSNSFMLGVPRNRTCHAIHAPCFTLYGFANVECFSITA